MKGSKKRFENVKDSPKIKILGLLVELPDEPTVDFLVREIGMLNLFIERYNEDFAKVRGREKKDSMSYWISDVMRPEMDKRWGNFNYVTDESKYPKYTTHDHKFGEPPDLSKKKKTLWQWINEA